MDQPPASNATALLLEMREDSRAAAKRLMPLAYDELHALASHYLRQERAGHTLQPTALVHEAYLRLVDQTRVDWRDRTHFVAVAAQSMRRILVDHARAHLAAKRGGGWSRITLSDCTQLTEHSEVDVIALDEVLSELARLNERHARIVELRFFGGLTIEETARALDLSSTTVEDSWTVARAWLRARLSQGDRS